MHTMLQLRIAALSLAAACATTAGAATITTTYGDNDGFGIGATSGSIDPTVGHASAGEAALTDVRLIGSGYAAPTFAPTGSFAPFSIAAGSIITSATLTLRLGSFVPTGPVDGPNLLKLDGVDFSPFIATFTSNLSNTDLVETHTLALPASFFTNLLDGSVSLNGTRISEGSGFGSFQVDFLQIDITTSAAAVPEPAGVALLAAGLVGFAASRRRRRAA